MSAHSEEAQKQPDIAHELSISAQATGITQMQVELEAIKKERSMLRDEIEYRSQDIKHLRKQNASLTQELCQIHQQTEDSRQRSDMIIMHLTQQLEKTQLQLEDLRQKETVWQKIRNALGRGKPHGKTDATIQ